MKAITTRYCGPTNCRGARIIASEPDGKRMSVPYPHELSGAEVHRHAADALMARLGWTGPYVSGYQRPGVYAHVFT